MGFSTYRPIFGSGIGSENDFYNCDSSNPDYGSIANIGHSYLCIKIKISYLPLLDYFCQKKYHLNKHTRWKNQKGKKRVFFLNKKNRLTPFFILLIKINAERALWCYKKKN